MNKTNNVKIRRTSRFKSAKNLMKINKQNQLIIIN